MKLATYQDGSRDGQLVVVSQDLKQAHFASHIASRMQYLLDDWNFIAPQLEQLYTQLNQGKAPYPFAFEPKRCMAPLPRPMSYLQSNMYASVVNVQTPLHITNASPSVIALPCGSLAAGDLAHNADFAAGLAVITEDIPRGSGKEQALDGVRLFMLNCNVFTSDPIALSEGCFDKASHIMTLFSPVAITCDEIGQAWQQGKLQLRLDVYLNGQAVALCPTDEATAYSWGDALSHACRHHSIATGSILDSGAVMHSNETKGFTSILQKRLRDEREGSAIIMPYLQAEDHLRLEIKGKDGQSLFGSISLKAQSAIMAP